MSAAEETPLSDPTHVSCPAHPDADLGPAAFHKDGVGIHRCPDCGTYAFDAEYATDQYDDEDYYTLATSDPAHIERRWGLRWRYVLERISTIENGRPTGARSPLSVLDVGAGNGSFVKIAADEFGFDATGIEVAPAAGEFARKLFGVELVIGDIADHRGTYDIVTSFNVIEHVPEPIDMLERMVERIRPGGLLVLTTPSPGAIQRRVRGIRKWAMICPPHHLHIFSEKALDAMLGEAGLSVLDSETISTYVRALTNRDTNAEHLRRTAFRALKATGLGADRMIIARKR